MSSSDFLTHAQKAALHRETYTSVLKGLLPFGSAREFAVHDVDITPVYLSNLLDPNHNPPSPHLAQRIVAALPLDQDQRLSLLEHMLLAREEGQRGQQMIRRYAREDIVEAQAVLRRTYDVVLSTQNSEDFNTHILSLRDMGSSLLEAVNPKRGRLIYVEMCLIIYYAHTSLNRWEAALFATHLADTALRQCDSTDEGFDAEWYHHLSINILYARAITYRNLNLIREAAKCADQALAAAKDGTPAQCTIWLPAIYREKLEILGRQSRFALSEVEGLGDQIRAICDARAAEGDRTLLLLVDRALINAWVTYGSRRSLKRADIRLRARLDELDSLPGVGPLQRVMFLRSAARYFWRQGHRDEGQHFTRKLIQTATDAGLRHQLSQAKREFGAAWN